MKNDVLYNFCLYLQILDWKNVLSLFTNATPKLKQFILKLDITPTKFKRFLLPINYDLYECRSCLFFHFWQLMN